MKTFILTIFLLQVAFSPKTESVAPNYVESKNNTTSIPKDTVDINIVKYPYTSWFEKNEGSLISGIIGVLIALISVGLSSLSGKRKEEKKIRELYKGYLFAVNAELFLHKDVLPFLKEEFETIISKSIEFNKIVLGKPTRIIPMSFLTELRLKLLESPIYNSQIFIILTGYLSKCESINNDVDLTKISKLPSQLIKSIELPAALKEYFEIVAHQIENVQKAREDLVGYIKEELVKYGVELNKNEIDYIIRK